MRARLTAALLSACAVGALVIQSPVTGPAQAADDPAAQVQAAQAELQALKGEVDRAAAELRTGTEALAASEAHLAGVQADATRTRKEADAAVVAAEQTRLTLTDVVAANFKNRPPGTLSVVLTSGSTGLGDLIRNEHDREQVQGNQQDLLRQADTERVRAGGLVRNAEQLEARAAVESKAVQTQVENLKSQAAAINVRLQAAAQKLAAAEEAKRKADEEAAARARAAAQAAAAEAARQAAAARDASSRRAAAAAAAAAQAAVPAAPRAGGGGGGGGGRGVVSGGGGGCTASSVSSYPNGFIPASALCSIGGGHSLRADAAKAFLAMNAVRPLCVTDSYRDYASQVDVYRRKPDLAAIPGNSNHGEGIAVDFCGGVQNFGSEAYQWMKANAPRFGWVHPSWAEAGGSKPEAWHWEYVG